MFIGSQRCNNKTFWGKITFKAKERCKKNKKFLFKVLEEEKNPVEGPDLEVIWKLFILPHGKPLPRDRLRWGAGTGQPGNHGWSWEMPDWSRLGRGAGGELQPPREEKEDPHVMGTCSVCVVRAVRQLPRLGEMLAPERVLLRHRCSRLNNHGAATGIGRDEPLARSGRC